MNSRFPAHVRPRTAVHTQHRRRTVILLTMAGGLLLAACSATPKPRTEPATPLQDTIAVIGVPSPSLPADVATSSAPGAGESTSLAVSGASPTTVPVSTVPVSTVPVSAARTTLAKRPPASVTAAPAAPDVPVSIPASGASNAAARGYGEALPFTTTAVVPDRLLTLLVIGSDARPGEKFTRTRADSLHLVAINPTTHSGTILGFPRDSYVAVPGHGRTKINASLVYGGPELTVETITQLTGIAIDYFVVTGFDGFTNLVNELGGVKVNVKQRMNDAASGAVFAAGIQLFNGPASLAFARDRHDVPLGDFGRSLHQGELLIAGLAKLRAETSDDAGLANWATVLLRRTALNVPPQALGGLMALARSVEPGALANVVVPGATGTAGRSSVVLLASGAPALYADVRSDGVLNGR